MKLNILSLCTQRCYFPKINKALVVYRFYCMALFYSQTQRHMIKNLTCEENAVVTENVINK